MRLAKMLDLYMSVNKIGVRKLAKEIGVSPSTISRITNGYDMDGRNMIKLLVWLMESEIQRDAKK